MQAIHRRHLTVPQGETVILDSHFTNRETEGQRADFLLVTQLELESEFRSDSETQFPLQTSMAPPPSPTLQGLFPCSQAWRELFTAGPATYG